MCSLDIARKQLAVKGKELLEEALQLARWARNEINSIGGYYAFGRELVGTPGCFDFDETKLSINVNRLGFTGHQIEIKLRKEYNIQVEMSDLNNILAVVTLGDKKENLAALVDALKDIASKSIMNEANVDIPIPDNPELIITPREAFYSSKKTVRLSDSLGEIAGEMVMAYPPGIPVIGLGERITKDVIDYIEIMKKEKCQLQGTTDPQADYIKILGKE
jgi:arginine decarboxylase